MTRPAHLRPGLVALVAAGGMVGTTARYLVAGQVPQPGGFPLGTLLENVVGSLLLGLLLEVLVRRGPETPGRRAARLALGTGVLGGFTTFSSLAVELERLLADGAVGIAAAYAVASLALGLTACLAGVGLGAWLAGRRRGADADADGDAVPGASAAAPSRSSSSAATTPGERG